MSFLFSYIYHLKLDMLKKGLMKQLLRNIIPVFLALVFLLPTFIKFSHHHEHHYSTPTHKKQFSVSDEKCPVCNFEFSVFQKGKISFGNQKNEINIIHNPGRLTSTYADFHGFSFLLRAPPLTLS
jgi:hypothetical protein